MSDFDRRALDELVEEAKEHLDVDVAGGAPHAVDWSRLEARVMAAVEAERPAVVRAASQPRLLRSREGVVRTAALVLAVAAGVAVFVHHDRGTALRDLQSVTTDTAPASSLRSGQVRIGAIVATPGYVVHAADTIEVDGARATFERARKVTWLLEQDSLDTRSPGAARARVKSAGEPLVMGLDHGAIEAQVAPVAVGEAFAVDIATDHGIVRVAVHGTHLRVARAGNHVVVDLTEGVVSIGVPPRTGMTYGTLVTAPAHVELDATDLRTLRVDHAPASVRTAIPLNSEEAAVGAGGWAGAPPEPASSAAHLATPSLLVQPPLAPGKGAVARPVDTGPPTPSKVEAPAVAVPPRQTIVTAVRDCATARSRSGDVRVTVTSNLRLRVSAAGVVETAQFSPPLLPEIQTCAAETIYRTKLDEAGLVTIPIEFSY